MAAPALRLTYSELIYQRVCLCMYAVKPDLLSLLWTFTNYAVKYLRRICRCLDARSWERASSAVDERVEHNVITAPFNNMRTLKFKAQPTNTFFATVNQMFAGSSQLSTAAVSWEDPPNTWLTAAKNAFVGWAFNFRVRVLLKSAVNDRC